MSIAGASASVRRLLEDHLVATGGLDGYTVSLFSTRGFVSGLTNRVALFLYRVDVDESRRQVHLPRATPTAPSRFALGLELHYMLTVWGSQDPEGEQQMLSRCMDALERHSLVSGNLLHPSYTWEPQDALRVSLAHISTEDMLRLWDSLEPSYQLSVPYVVRTARLSAREQADPVLADTRTLALTQGAPR